MEEMEQENRAHSQEATQQHAELNELKVKWVEFQDVVTSAAEYESSSMERIKNLEYNPRWRKLLRPKRKGLRLRKGSERSCNKNVKTRKTNSDLAKTYNILKVDNEWLQSKIQEL